MASSNNENMRASLLESGAATSTTSTSPSAGEHIQRSSSIRHRTTLSPKRLRFIFLITLCLIIAAGVVLLVLFAILPNINNNSSDNPSGPGQKTLWQCDATQPMKKISLFHLNDVYNEKTSSGDGHGLYRALYSPVLADYYFTDIQTRPTPMGGMHHVSYQLNKLRKNASAAGFDSYFTFAGDFLGPSALSAIKTYGLHMIDFLNILGLNATVFGNHEFDNGAGLALMQMQQSNFPWIVANVNENLTTNSYIPLASNYHQFNKDGTVNPNLPYNTIIHLPVHGMNVPVPLLYSQTSSGLRLCIFGVTQDDEFPTSTLGKTKSSTISTFVDGINLTDVYFMRSQQNITQNPNILKLQDDGSHYEVFPAVQTGVAILRALNQQTQVSCDLVLGLNHIYIGDDEALAQQSANFGGVDFLLGGHDHIPMASYTSRAGNAGTNSAPPTLAVKCGMDAQIICEVDVALNPCPDDNSVFCVCNYTWTMHAVVPESSPWTSDDDLLAYSGSDVDILQAQYMLQRMQHWESYLGSMYRVINIYGYEGLYDSTTVRFAESPVTNLFVDMIRNYSSSAAYSPTPVVINADIGIINTGSIRGARLAPDGIIPIQEIDVKTEVPFVGDVDTVGTVVMNGTAVVLAVLQALKQNNTGMYQQFSGLEIYYWFVCDSQQSCTATIGDTLETQAQNIHFVGAKHQLGRPVNSNPGTPIDLNANYTVAILTYLWTAPFSLYDPTNLNGGLLGLFDPATKFDSKIQLSDMIVDQFIQLNISGSGVAPIVSKEWPRMHLTQKSLSAEQSKYGRKAEAKEKLWSRMKKWQEMAEMEKQMEEQIQKMQLWRYMEENSIETEFIDGDFTVSDLASSALSSSDFRQLIHWIHRTSPSSVSTTAMSPHSLASSTVRQQLESAVSTRMKAAEEQSIWSSLLKEEELRHMRTLWFLDDEGNLQLKHRPEFGKDPY